MAYESIREIIALAVLIALFGQLHGYAEWRTAIPNGESVPHPCNPNTIWEGVGHLARGGGGKRNQFGIDFDNQGRKWTVALCQMDSDEDGKTNGEELGDPNCVWVKGGNPNRTYGLSHPGICDPLESDVCRDKAAPNCEETEFKCDPIYEPDVLSTPVRFPPTQVPPRETSYTCMYFELPQDGDYHLIATTPIIDNVNVLHHMLVFASPDTITNIEFNKPFDCFMGAVNLEVIAGWTVGNDGTCFHPAAGYRIGSHKKGLKIAMIELHWNNPWFVGDYMDSSGMMLYYTPKLRPHDNGVFIVSQIALEIPPDAEDHLAEATCSSTCTKQIMTGPINVIASFNHMHYLGRRALTEVITPTTRVDVARDDVYNFDNPIFYEFPEPLRVEPGHEFNLKCYFTSTTRTKSTYFGAGTSDEMCAVFVMYYPKENVLRPNCFVSKDIDACELEQPVVRGCNATKMFDSRHPDNLAKYASLDAHCAVGYCRKECIDVVKEINSDPCYNGTIRDLRVRGSKEIQDEASRLYYERFWAMLQSCDAEILREAYSRVVIPGDQSASALAPLASHSAVYIGVLFCFLFSS